MKKISLYSFKKELVGERASCACSRPTGYVILTRRIPESSFLRNARYFFYMLIPLLSACSDANFPEYVYLDSLRVVAMIPSRPEAAPGNSITVTPLVSDVKGNARPLTYTAKGCMDPASAGLGSDAEITCDGREDGLNTSGSFSMPGPEFTGNGPVLNIKIPAAALAGRSAAEQFIGLYYIVLFTVTDPDGKSLKTLKRIMVTSVAKLPKNTNPIVSDIRTGNESLTILPTQDATLKADIPLGAQEQYSTFSSDFKMETKTEDFYTTWFVTDGKLDGYRSIPGGGVVWTPPASLPSSRKAVVIAVTRDGRGGETAILRSF